MAEASGPKLTAAGKKFQDATKRVQTALTLDDAMAAMTGADATERHAGNVLAMAQVHAARKMEKQEQVLRDEERKDQITNLVLLVLFFDMLGPVLMMSNSASIFGPPPPSTTPSQVDGGTGLFFTNGDVSNFPIGKGVSTQASNPWTPVACHFYLSFSDGSLGDYRTWRCEYTRNLPLLV